MADAMELCSFEEALETHDPKLALEVKAKLQTDLNRRARRYPSGEMMLKMFNYDFSLFVAYQYTSESYKYWKYCNP